MKYYVSIGDIELDKVVAVAQSSDRDISVYDSVGGGKFAVPQNKGLRTWTIKCEIDDHNLIKQFDKMQKKKTPARLVINTDGYKVSERVLLKSYNAPEEEYAGVWPVTLTVIEYVKVGVKTADVPYVAREGNRVLAATAVIGDGTGGTKTPFQLALEAEQAGLVADGKDLFLGGFVRDESGKILYNPVAIPDNTPVNIAYQNTSSDNAWAEEDERQRRMYQTANSQKWNKLVGDAMSSALRKFDELMGNPYQK